MKLLDCRSCLKTNPSSKTHSHRNT